MSARVLVPIADGTEEMEAVIIIDVLRRAQIRVVVASVSRRLLVTASRGVQLVAETFISDLPPKTTDFDMIALPGGMPGATHLAASPHLSKLLKQQAEQQKWIAAICASPAVVLQPLGLLSGVSATCHPAFQQDLKGSQLQTGQAVVIDHDSKRVTSQGPGTAFTFALTLVELLAGHRAAQQVAEPMCFIGE